MTQQQFRGPWMGPPGLPPTHYIDNRIYTDAGIFDEEQRKIFAGGWKLVCHDSEIPNPGDYRTAKVAGVQLVIVRDKAMRVRAFFNTCPHRGAELVRDPQGNLGRGFQCFYHLWTFNLEGRCTGITRPTGYQQCGLRTEDVGLRVVRTEVVCGLVFVSLKDDVEEIETYLGDALPHIKEYVGAVELEVIHHHSAVIKSNWKLWNDNNSELYHEFLHVFNRKTSISDPGYNKRHWHIFRSGHSLIEQGNMQYGNWGLDTRSEGVFPGIRPNGVLVMTLFPDVLINIRATIMRLDTMTPLSPGETLVEWRGLGFKSDTPEIRAMRIRHHNQVWGPAGKNLPEDIAAVESQWRNMVHGASRYSIIAREENLQPQDDSNVRAFYQEWGRRAGYWPHNFEAPRDLTVIESLSQRAIHA